MTQIFQRASPQTKIPQHFCIIISELIIFSLTYVLALVVASKIEGFTKVGERLPLWSRPVDLAFISFGQFIFAFLVATLFIILALKVFKRGLFFKIIFALALWVGIEIVFSLILPNPWSSFLALALVILMFKVNRVWLLNFSIILGVAGLGADLGLKVLPLTAILILIFLSFYDFLAVLKTKHMIRMFRGLAQKKVFFSLIIPTRIRNFNTSLEKVELPSSELAGKPQLAPRRTFLFLGIGDLALPLILVISVLSEGLARAVGVALGTLIGVVFTHFMLIRKKRPLPALPPLALFSILGYLAGRLF